MRRPALLAILDGVGLAMPGPGNAVTEADAPFIHLLFSDTTWPSRPIDASGPAVGLPVGQMGNSEVGHLNIGAGRVVDQELTRIDKGIADRSFFANPVLCQAFHQVKPPHRLHLIGLISDGGVHSRDQHLYALLELAAQCGVRDIALHLYLDGRDVSPTSGIGYILATEDYLQSLAAGQPQLKAQIASLGGRYYGMDRDQRWTRVAKAWQAIVSPLAADAGIEVLQPGSAAAVLASAYSLGTTDEFLQPVAFDTRGVCDGDTVVSFNFRPDRAREMARAFIEPGFSGFQRDRTPEVGFVCMTEYDPLFAAYGAKVAFAKQAVENTLADYLSGLGLRQLHIAETEKYAHVTFFLNGGIEEPKPLEQRILVASPKVATYDLQPQMSAYEVTQALVAAIEADQADAYIVNFANGDMVGHTGIMPAAVAAIEAIDDCLGQVINAVLAKDGAALVTADHGNAEQMLDQQGNPWTAHSMSPVPLTLLAREARAGGRSLDLLRSGPASLADVAPTFLQLIGLPSPPEFSGRSLLTPQAGSI